MADHTSLIYHLQRLHDESRNTSSSRAVDYSATAQRPSPPSPKISAGWKNAVGWFRRKKNPLNGNKGTNRLDQKNHGGWLVTTKKTASCSNE
jgi:hypothetical protein